MSIITKKTSLLALFTETGYTKYSDYIITDFAFPAFILQEQQENYLSKGIKTDYPQNYSFQVSILDREDNHASRDVCKSVLATKLKTWLTAINAKFETITYITTVANDSIVISVCECNFTVRS